MSKVTFESDQTRVIASPIKRDGRTGYVCGCGAEQWFSLYAVAQMAMGHALTHRCECKRVNDVLPGSRVLLGAPNEG